MPEEDDTLHNILARLKKLEGSAMVFKLYEDVDCCLSSVAELKNADNRLEKDLKKLERAVMDNDVPCDARHCKDEMREWELAASLLVSKLNTVDRAVHILTQDMCGLKGLPIPESDALLPYERLERNLSGIHKIEVAHTLRISDLEKKIGKLERAIMNLQQQVDEVRGMPDGKSNGDVTLLHPHSPPRTGVYFPSAGGR